MTGNLDVQKLVERACRSVRISQMVRGVLMVLLIYSLLVLFIPDKPEATGGANAILLGVCIAWVLLSVRAKHKASETTVAGQLIAVGQISQAQEILAGVCRGLCVHKPVQLLACHNLAVTCQRQGYWMGAWQLCELVRASARKKHSEIIILSESLRAQCSLAMNNLSATYESLSVLSAMLLSITERLGFLQTEIIYSIRVGHSDAVMADLENKVALAGLLPSEQAAVVHAWLALAAHLARQTARRDWLWEKATLYCPPEQLLERNAAWIPVAQAARLAKSEPCKSTGV